MGAGAVNMIVWIALGLGLAAAFAAWLARDAANKQRARGSAERRSGSKRRAERDAASGSRAGHERPAAAPGTARPGRDAPVPAPAQGAAAPAIPRIHAEDDDDEDITRISFAPSDRRAAPAPGDDEDEDTTRVVADQGAIPIVFDEDALADEPTAVAPLILVSATGQSDPGRVRRRNEDSFALLEEQALYVVADGMGGHRGGQVASRLAVDVLTQAFTTRTFVGKPYPNVPRRGSELVLGIQMANHAIFEHAASNADLEGMGTTVVAARFSPTKERVYVGHVGDSRCYRLRGGQLRQMTTDHNMRSQGMVGPFAEHLSRAVGVEPGVNVDLVIARPRTRDRYLLCSDGLSKMVDDDAIRDILVAAPDLQAAVDGLIAAANKSGGKDNITVILVEVRSLRP